MSITTRKKQPREFGAQIFIAGIIWLLVSTQLVVRVGNFFVEEKIPTPINPIVMVGVLVENSGLWKVWHTVAALLWVAFLVVVVGGFLWKKNKPKPRIDVAANHIGKAVDVKHLTLQGIQETAKRLGSLPTKQPGILIGQDVYSGKRLYGSYECMHLDIWGPRTGKTTSRAIPAIVNAPGAVFATSNKRDILDATREIRGQKGRVWVFDPQSIANEPPSWWWNPLDYVKNEATSLKLAEFFVFASRQTGAKTDAYFDSAAQDLLAGFLLAAALENLPITQVHTWLTQPNSDEAAVLLHEHGFVAVGREVLGVVSAPSRQKAGVFGTATQMASFLKNRETTKWVTPNEGCEKFDVEAFTKGSNTLFLLSKEDRATAAPLVTAFTAILTEGFEDLAKTQPGGRLASPVVGVLDEAANICRWKELPSLYSHYGSRGILLMTILQSWSQGVEVWGRDGMTKLFSAANVFVYGGGVRETDFLANLVKICGEYRYTNITLNHSKRGVSSGMDTDRKENVLEVADLASLPKGRALLLASGSKPLLVKPVPWMKEKYAPQIQESIKKHNQ